MGRNAAAKTFMAKNRFYHRSIGKDARSNGREQKRSAGHRDTDTGLVDATTRGVPTTDRDQRQLQTGGLAHETRDGVDFNNRKI